MIRLLGTFLIALMMLAFGIGCKPQPAKAPDGKIEIEFWTLQLMDFKDLLGDMFAEYEKAHPNVRIKWVDVPFSEGEKRTLTVMMSDDVPDVVNLNPDFSAILASRNALLNLNEWVTSEQRESYLPVAWQTATLKQSGKQNTFGFPWYITSSVTLYNTQLLKKAGLSQPPGSYKDIIDAAVALKKSANVYALMPVIAERGNFLKELKKNGVRLYDDTGRAVFAREGSPLLQRFVELYKRDLIPAETLTESHRAAVDRYQSGTLAMLLSGANFLNIVKENAPVVFKETQVAPQFPKNSLYKDFSMMILVVPKKSKHPKEAVDFALFVTNKLNQLKLAQAAPVLPSVNAALEDSYFQKSKSADIIERARSISAGQLLSAKEAYQIQPGQQEINAVVDHHVQLALLGKLLPAEALLKAEKAVNDIIESNRSGL